MPSNLFFEINFTLSIIASIIGFTFSCTTLFIVIVHRQCHTINNLLTCNTCVAVIFYSIIVLQSSIYGFREDWTLNAPHCQFRAYCFNVAIAATCHSKSLHAISRLFSAVFYKYKFLLTWRTHFSMIIINWILCFVSCLLPFFIPHGFALEKESRSCVVTSRMTLLAAYIALTSSIIPFNIITSVYGMILFHVHRSTRRIRALRAQNVPESLNNPNLTRKTTREVKLMKQMIIQMSILLVGGPIFLFLIFWHAITSQSAPEFLYLLGFNSMSFVAAAVTVVQFLMDEKLKRLTFEYISQCLISIRRHRQIDPRVEICF